MNESRSDARWHDRWAGYFLRFAATGLLPAAWFQQKPPPLSERAARTGQLHIELVSHCWQYAHLLVYQLSSLVLFPPTRCRVTMTVYYNDADTRTRELLDFFAALDVPGVDWNWREQPAALLFRRAIGRNEAALATAADWIWFTDCDLMFRRDCLDELTDALQGRRDALVYPGSERTTSLLPDSDALLDLGRDSPRIVDIDDSRFIERSRSRATGPLQIVHGDVARAVGYCSGLRHYQKPSPIWRKTYEDRAFRWLLGTQGVPLEIPGVYRIRHIAKGRYTGSAIETGLRSRVRRAVARVKEG